MSTLIVLSGPTATGKTQTSLKLAQKLEAEIINFDSLLFYKELNIGSAKPTIEERGQILHHLIDISSIKNPLNAHDFSIEVEKIIKKNQTYILVGGSGFYLQAFLKGMYSSATTPKEIFKKSNELYQNSGIAPFIEYLSKFDPESLMSLHANDHYRLRRAVEHHWTNGTTFSEAKKLKAIEYTDERPHLHLYLDLPKSDHEIIIKERTKNMLKNGLIEEVEHLLQLGFSGEEKPLKSIGYKETIDYLNKKIPDLVELETQINIHTRQLAKSQRTWFKKINKIVYNPLEQFNEIIQEGLNYQKLFIGS